MADVINKTRSVSDISGASPREPVSPERPRSSSGNTLQSVGASSSQSVGFARSGSQSYGRRQSWSNQGQNYGDHSGPVVVDVRDHVDLMLTNVSNQDELDTANQQAQADDPFAQIDDADHCLSRFAIREKNVFRSIWQAVVAVLLLYTGTGFLFFLCFYELHVPEVVKLPAAIDGLHWVLDIAFWFDLFVYFFFTYTNRHGNEIDSLWKIGKHYMKTTLIINVLACLPNWMFELLFAWLGIMPGGNTNKAVRTIRLQRLSKLFRLVRLGRLAKLLHLKNHPFWRKLKNFRSVRCLNFLGMMLFTVHVCACGWYLCAAVSTDESETWLNRRSIDTDGTTLLGNSSPFLQWVHSMYFVLTVFTTVGFGDMSAANTGEICIVILIFLIGAVVHGYVIGEVINLVTRSDDVGEFVASKKALLESFSIHTELGSNLKDHLVDWVENQAAGWISHQYDKTAMRELITGRYMKRETMALLPPRLFGGQLIANTLFTRLPHKLDILPPRLPTLLALSLYKSYFEDMEYVYQRRDLAFGLFLVTNGTFANIALALASGGKEVCLASPEQDSAQTALHPYKFYSCNSYFGEEVIMRRVTRSSTVRCEKGGWTLVAPKRNLHQLFEEFPQFASLWLQTAIRHERRRLQLLVDFKDARTFRHAAAAVIQRFICRRREEKKLRGAAATVGSTQSNNTVHEAINILKAQYNQGASPAVDAQPIDAVVGQKIVEELRLQREELQSLRQELHYLKSAKRAGVRDVVL